MIAMLLRRLYRVLSVAVVPKSVMAPAHRPRDVMSGGVLLNLDEFR